MIDKRPIDRLRDGAISLEVKTPDDDSAISIMITVGDRLLVVKEKGIYEIKPADKIESHSFLHGGHHQLAHLRLSLPRKQSLLGRAFLRV
jgi:hypothetical protein